VLKECFLYCLLLTSCSFCDSIITQIYTPGAFGIRLRYEYARSGSHGSSLFVNESSTTTHPALAPLSHLHPDMAYAKPMTSVTSSLAKRAGLPLSSSISVQQAILCQLTYSDKNPLTLLMSSSKTIQTTWATQNHSYTHPAMYFPFDAACD
jgi:hypothetical protein